VAQPARRVVRQDKIFYVVRRPALDCERSPLGLGVGFLFSGPLVKLLGLAFTLPPCLASEIEGEANHVALDVRMDGERRC
jgi:hypothetical protein